MAHLVILIKIQVSSEKFQKLACDWLATDPPANDMGLNMFFSYAQYIWFKIDCPLSEDIVDKSFLPQQWILSVQIPTGMHFCPIVCDQYI